MGRWTVLPVPEAQRGSETTRTKTEVEVGTALEFEEHRMLEQLSRLSVPFSTAHTLDCEHTAGLRPQDTGNLVTTVSPSVSFTSRGWGGLQQSPMPSFSSRAAFSPRTSLSLLSTLKPAPHLISLQNLFSLVSVSLSLAHSPADQMGAAGIRADHNLCLLRAICIGIALSVPQALEDECMEAFDSDLTGGTLGCF